MSHECPADGCGKTVGQSVLMCRSHWQMVPRPAQREVTGAWRVYSRVRQRKSPVDGSRMEARRNYLGARQAAVDFVNGRLSKA